MPRSNTLFVGHPPPPWHLGGDDDGYPRRASAVPANPRLDGCRPGHARPSRLARSGDRRGLSLSEPAAEDAATGRRRTRTCLLLFTLQRQAYKDLVLAFPLATDDAKWNTRWFLKPLFPLFLRNVLYTLGNVRDATTEETVRPGSPKAIAAVRRREGGQSPHASRGRRRRWNAAREPSSRTAATTELGVYEATLGGSDAAIRGEPVRPEREPHRTATVREDRRSAKSRPARRRKQPRELWRWAVAGRACVPAVGMVDL